MPDFANSQLKIAEVAVAVPLYQRFDFLIPNSQQIAVGSRVSVPFGRRQMVGIVTQLKNQSDFPLSQLKSIIDCLDAESVFTEDIWQTLLWMQRYYAAPIGEVFDLALPAKLRQGAALKPAAKSCWKLINGFDLAEHPKLNRAPVQKQLVEYLLSNLQITAEVMLGERENWRRAIKQLMSKQLVVEQELSTSNDSQLNDPRLIESSVTLNSQQAIASNQIRQAMDNQSFSCSLLHGVTGSGKTEVYFDAIRTALSEGKQCLLLVPEIGLTPQLLDWVCNTVAKQIVTVHSGLSDTERHQAWWQAKTGEAQIVIGTRSAVFTPFKNLGLIVVDEEHDASFKQQDGVRYHSRDVAIYRAKLLNIPIVLGSATPSLESFANSKKGRFGYIELSERATQVALPKVSLIDTTHQPLNEGLTPAMLEAIKKTLAQQAQVMLYLNRRGFAPVLYCGECKTSQKCHRCDSNLTVHRQSNSVRCHHCGYQAKMPNSCQACGSLNLCDVGEGTQRVEQALNAMFAEAKVLRIDRDSTRRKGELEAALAAVRNGEVDILIGTQLLTKGHDFPNIGMVGILGADHGLYSTDFRANEHLFQQIVQVAGRAGRRQTCGQVFIQTAFVEHPFFEFVKNHDYHAFAEQCLQERQSAALPPSAYLTLFRAESVKPALAIQFLKQVKARLIAEGGVNVMDPIAAPMERRAGKYRAQLLLQAQQRSSLNQCLEQFLNQLNTEQQLKKLARTVRWSIDVDPQDLY